MTTEHDRLTGQLAAVLTDALGEGIEVCAVERLKGGYSRHMWAFDSNGVRSGTACWILCTDADNGVVGAHSLSRPREARLLDYVHRAGLPVPAIKASGHGPEPFGTAWFVMQRLPGTATVGPLLRDPEISAMRTTLGHQKAGLLARIHALAVPDDVLGPVPAPERIADIETRRWAQALTETPRAQTETMDAALDRLERSTPPAPDRLCIVHGDYRTGNLLYDRSGITGVLDWEMAHAGDPTEDVAWAQLASWRVGTGLVGALLTDAEWIEAYQAASGRAVDQKALRFWQLFAGVKMSLLAWRAVERTPPGKELDLLRTLFTQLQNQLRENLLG